VGLGRERKLGEGHFQVPCFDAAVQAADRANDSHAAVVRHTEFIAAGNAAGAAGLEYGHIPILAKGQHRHQVVGDGHSLAVALQGD